MNFDRISVEPEKLEGKPSVRGLRITVETVVRLVAAGWTFDEILAEYPDLDREDIRQALEYAAASANVHVYRLPEPADGRDQWGVPAARRERPSTKMSMRNSKRSSGSAKANSSASAVIFGKAPAGSEAM